MFKQNKIPHTWISMLGSLILMFAFVHPVSAAMVGTGATSIQMPLFFLRSADCTDEVVEIRGTIHLVNQTQTDGTVIGHFNYQNVSAVGLTSGNIYRVSSVDQSSLASPFPSDITSVQSFHLISLGSSSNLLVHVLFHITVNAEGDVTASISDLDMQCT